MKLILAVLQNMWDPRSAGRRSPDLFVINPLNHSGQRLYKLISAEANPERKLLVTNASRMITRKAAEGHFSPDLEALGRVLSLRPWSLVLVCGAVANAAFEALPEEAKQNGVRHLSIPHPAARTWSKALILETQIKINDLLS